MLKLMHAKLSKVASVASVPYSIKHLKVTSDRQIIKGLFIKTCVAGLVLSVTRILRAALTKLRVYVCMYVCV